MRHLQRACTYAASATACRALHRVRPRAPDHVIYNPLPNLPGSLGFLRSLVNVGVERCPLRMPPADVAAMWSVRILKFLKEVRLSVEANALDLSRLALEVRPASLCHHTDLTSLVLNDNVLASLPSAVAAMTKLHTLVLSRNKI